MENPFLNLISPDFKQLWHDAISELVTSLATNCRLIFGEKMETCESCGGGVNSTGKKPTSVYVQGSPVHFNNVGRCGVCSGKGKRLVETSENISLAVIWNYRDFIIDVKSLKTPQGLIQTISRLDPTLPKIKKAKELVVGTDIEKYMRHRFVRNGEPIPVGMRNDETDFIVVTWKSSGG